MHSSTPASFCNLIELESASDGQWGIISGGLQRFLSRDVFPEMSFQRQLAVENTVHLPYMHCTPFLPRIMEEIEGMTALHSTRGNNSQLLKG